MAGGQPTKYRKKFCEMLLTHMQQGSSFESFGAIAGCNRDTLYEWARRHPEFSDAKTRGTMLALLWWEQIAKSAVTNGKVKMNGVEIDQKFNSNVWLFTMKNRFGWRDAMSMEHSGPEGGPIQVEEKKTSADYQKKLDEIEAEIKKIMG